MEDVNVEFYLSYHYAPCGYGGKKIARVHTIVGGWRLHISRILYGCLGSIDLVSSKEQGFDSPTVDLYGLLAQLGERLPCKQEVVGSIPTGSTIVPY